MKLSFRIVLIGLFFSIFSLIPIYPGISCGIEDWNTPLYSEYSFFDPDAQLMSPYRHTPLFSFNRIFFPQKFGYNASSMDANIAEWQQFFSRNISEDDLRNLVYKFPLNTLQNIHQYLNNQAFDLPDSLKSKPYLTYFAQNPQKIPFFEYLIYAKDCGLNNHHSATAWELNDDYKEEEGFLTVPYEMDMNELAWRYNLDTELIKKLNNWPPQTKQVYRNQKILVKYAYKEYIAKSGETLEEIAQKHRVDLHQLFQWNKLYFPNYDNQSEEPKIDIEDILQAGNTIKLHINPDFIPKTDLTFEEEIYEEKELVGRKFSEIADWYNIPEQDLKAYNKIGFDRKTYFGQKLRIPTITHKVKVNETVETLAEKYGQNEWRLEGILRRSFQKPKPKSTAKATVLKEGQKILIYKNPREPKDLIMMGLKAYQKESSPFLKLRYAYQVVRLAHYSGLYDDCLMYFEQLVKPLWMNESIMKYWALEHKGGALRKLNRKAEANLCFAQVFNQGTGRQFTAFQSFFVESDFEWQKMLQLCETTAEKAALYFIRAVSPNANALEEMQNIYQLDPQSKELEILLIREINKLEFDLLKADLDKNIFFIQRYKGLAPKEALAYLADLQQFIRLCIAQNKIKRPELWQLAQIYTEVLNGNASQASQDLQNLSKQIQNPDLLQNTQMMEILLEISQLKVVNREVEESFFQKIQSLKNEKLNNQSFHQYFKAQNDAYTQLLEYLQRVFHHLYSPHQKAKKILSDPYFSLNELKLNSSLSDTKALIEFIAQKDKNTYEQFLAEKIDLAPNIQLSILYELQGTLYLADNQEVKALASFQKIPQSNTFLKSYLRNPFQKIYKRTYNNTDRDKINSLTINKLTITQEIIALKQKVEKNSPDQAEVYFKLGNLYFNLTTYGDFYDIFNPLVGEYLEKDKQKWVGYKYVNVPFRDDFSLARSYFEQGMKIAVETGDLELAARCCFGIAECQNHQFFNQKKWEDKVSEKRMSLKISAENALAKVLIEQSSAYQDFEFYFKNTQYYQEVLKECSYFNEFVNSR
jgi:LysM repeat protein